MDSSSGNFLNRIPPVTRNLIIINVIVWLAEVIPARFGMRLIDILGLHYWGADDFNPVQMFTYMFLHDRGGIIHIFFNMFTLWMFGRILEPVWGSKRFLIYYFVCGIGAAVIQEVVWSLSWEHEYLSGIARLNGMTMDSMRQAVVENPAYFAPGIGALKNSYLTVGASGAIFGILLGFAFVFPDLPMYIFFIPIPIKAKYMVIGYAVLEFFLGMNGLQASVAHFAHLGGMIFGLVLLLYWKHNGTLRGDRFRF